ncbi:MAG: FAD-dependent 5-carboxymethylaminomethyl-2-thiouridine(34) oxidoreductase MnmC [Alphaproteobacteria bacterium]
MRLAIIGAGLAGTAAVYILKRYVSNIKIYEAMGTFAAKASGNPTGLVNPRFSAHKTPESEYYAQGFKALTQELTAIAQTPQGQAVGWRPCGALHLMVDGKRQKRFPQTVQNWGWRDEDLRCVDAAEASAIAGIPLAYDALYVRESGFLNPAALCRYYAHDVEVVTNKSVVTLEDMGALEADVIVIACGATAAHMEICQGLPLRSVRGQITQIRSAAPLSDLRCNLHYGGYCTPAMEGGVHALGATFQRWLDYDDIRAEDDVQNINELQRIVPKITEAPEICGQRAAIRSTTPDHIPIVGALDDWQGGQSQAQIQEATKAKIYLSLAHGSHGLVSSFAAAHILADLILGEDHSLFNLKTKQIVSLNRFANQVRGEQNPIGV